MQMGKCLQITSTFRDLTWWKDNDTNRIRLPGLNISAEHAVPKSPSLNKDGNEEEMDELEDRWRFKGNLR